MNEKAWVSLKGVSKKFILESKHELTVLDHVNVEIRPGEVVAFLGPSGSGKSTCLRIMSGLLQPSSGEVWSRGRPLQGVNHDVALVFQSFALFPWATVYSNIELALKSSKISPELVQSRIKKVIDLVGLEGFEEAYPRELSGGMKQRVGLARALVMERPLLFLDEPFSALDVLTADTLQNEVVKIFLDQKTAISSVLLVTHNIQEAVLMARRIFVMGANPGHIRQEILNDLPYPRNDQSVPFKRMVARIHALITETLMPDENSVSSVMRAQQSGSIEILPSVQIIEVIGLAEAVFDQNSTADLFELAQQLGRDFGKTLYLVKAAELLDLVETPKQLVRLTEAGRLFVQGDMNARKRMLHELFAELRIVQVTTDFIRSDERLRVPIESLQQQMRVWLPNENPEEMVNVLIAWGRFSEYFGYNDDTKEVYLDLGQEIHA